ncbi:Metastasis-suppressor KiSS-1 [Vulpes lagopus]
MNSLVSWQLMLLLCATSFRETLEKVAPMETPGPAGQRLGPQALPAQAQAPAPLEWSPPRGPRRARLPGAQWWGGPARLQLDHLRPAPRQAAGRDPGAARVNPKPQARDPCVGGAWGCGPEEK